VAAQHESHRVGTFAGWFDQDDSGTAIISPYNDNARRSTKCLAVFSRSPRATTLTFENRCAVLLMQPFEEFLKADIGQDGFHVVKRVAKFIVAPRFVDKILARMTRGNDLGPAFAARDNMMAPRHNGPLTEYAF
jgi:hypothetical protein